MADFDKRRAFGQHFLRDLHVIDQIVECAIAGLKEARCPALLEIGPGRGALTHSILKRLGETTTPIRHFSIVERDRDLAAYWSKYAKDPGTGSRSFQVSVDEADFMDFPDSKWLAHSPLAVVSNLPYSAGTAIVTRLCKYPRQIPIMVLMFQAEVAQRLRAEQSTKDWGSLSIWTQNLWDVAHLLDVPPEAFKPPPKVDSEVIVLKPRAEARVRLRSHPDAESQWQGLLKAAFAHRRKMLRSGLTGHWKEAFTRSGLDGTLRAEALSWNDWQRLYDSLLD